MIINWEKVDDLTPKYRQLIEDNLGVQERKVLSAICREVADGRISAKQAGTASRIYQTNHIHAVLSRLRKKGFLSKEGRSEYKVIDHDLVAHLLVRTSGLNPRTLPSFARRFSIIEL